MHERETFIPKHGGYRKLKSFQVAQLIYDITVRFCDLYINKYSRTRDQMVQAARSGVQNIAEGSQASGTSCSETLQEHSVSEIGGSTGMGGHGKGDLAGNGQTRTSTDKHGQERQAVRVSL